MLVKKTDWIM